LLIEKEIIKPKEHSRQKEEKKQKA